MALAFSLLAWAAVADAVRPTMTTGGPKTALVLLADGSEEMEVVIVVDVLRRAGIDVSLAGVHGSRPHKCSRNVSLVPDVPFDDSTVAKSYDVVVLPGGLQGALTFAANKDVGKLLKEQEQQGRLVAAICAAPIALMSHGVGVNRSITHHPSVAEQMDKLHLHKPSTKRVERDGNVITSQGPGTAFEFALALVEALIGKQKADQVAQPLLCKL